MATRERSKGGCWTCKLRKKKCDEGRSSCQTCLSLDITCHGYGPKPSWMDGGHAEKEKIEAIRLRVKDITNHKRKLRVRQRVSLSTFTDRLNLLPGSSGDVDNADPFEFWNRHPSQSDEVTRLDISPAHQLPTPSSTGGSSQVDEVRRHAPILSEEDAGLLMHYMDHVFPLQFPFYNNSALKGGRGWLLAILMQLDLLYHAALSISAYHRHYETYAHDYLLRNGSLAHTRDLPRCSILEDQLTEHILVIRRIGQILQRLGDIERSQSELKLTEYVELIACMATLISFEILKGDNDSWQVHLKAASYFLPLAHAAFQSDQVNDLSNAYKESFKFFSSALTWYIIQSHVTIEDIPLSEPTGLELTALHVSITDFAGCEEWVIRELIDIIKLRHWKEIMKSQKQLSIRELTTKASNIEARLKNEISILSESIEQSSPTDFFNKRPDYLKLLVTRVFAYTALVYLYMIESGPCPDVPEIHSNVSKVIEAFQGLPQASLVRNLSWPLCIAGSMATGGDQEAAFLEIAKRAEINIFPFGSAKHALAIVEECWRMRRGGEFEGGSVDWRVAMRKLGLNVLLV